MDQAIHQQWKCVSQEEGHTSSKADKDKQAITEVPQGCHESEKHQESMVHMGPRKHGPVYGNEVLGLVTRNKPHQKARTDHSHRQEQPETH